MLQRLHDPFKHLGLYVLLLVMTPFIMLQNYLQTAVGMASRASFDIFALEIPFVLAAFLAFLGAVLILARRSLNRYIGFSLALVLLHIAIGQQIADYYFRHHFYDLQHNWHYFAYSILAYLMYRALVRYELQPARIILFTFLGALVISSFDEAIQVLISSRVFDIGDIAKDTWGSLAGMIFIFCGLEKGCVFEKPFRIRHTRFKAYLESSLAALTGAWIFAFILLNVSSLLTESKYLLTAILITLCLAATTFLIIHLTQWKRLRWIIITGLTIVILAQVVAIVQYRDKPIVMNRYGLLVYRGLPLPFFDILIHPNGRPRLVDKKHMFNKRDQDTIHGLASDILLIGSGHEGQGGRGFRETTEMQFVFNKYTGRGMQVIILPTPQACKLYNRLQQEGRSVLFIIHNTC